jgi:hypothetical protein
MHHLLRHAAAAAVSAMMDISSPPAFQQPPTATMTHQPNVGSAPTITIESSSSICVADPDAASELAAAEEESSLAARWSTSPSPVLLYFFRTTLA